jgi:hypothetical protein
MRLHDGYHFGNLAGRLGFAFGFVEGILCGHVNVPQNIQVKSVSLEPRMLVRPSHSDESEL